MPLDFSSGRKPLSGFSLAGMTDIVLLLLIFFLLTSTFVVHHGIRVNLPQVTAAAPPEELHVSVALTAEGMTYVDGTEVQPEALESAILAAAVGKEAILLRADAEATVGQFAQVASAARAAGLRVLMATEPLSSR